MEPPPREVLNQSSKTITQADKFTKTLIDLISTRREPIQLNNFFQNRSKPEFAAQRMKEIANEGSNKSRRRPNRNQNELYESAWDMNKSTFEADKYANPFYRMRFVGDETLLGLFKETKAKLATLGLRFNRRKKNADDTLSNLLNVVALRTLRGSGHLEPEVIRPHLMSEARTEIEDLDFEPMDINWLRVAQIIEQVYSVFYNRIMRLELRHIEKYKLEANEELINYSLDPEIFQYQRDEQGLLYFENVYQDPQAQSTQKGLENKENLVNLDDIESDSEDDDLLDLNIQGLEHIINQDNIMALRSSLRESKIKFDFSFRHSQKRLDKREQQRRSGVLAQIAFDDISDDDPEEFIRRRKKKKVTKVNTLANAEDVKKFEEEIKNENLKVLNEAPKVKKKEMRIFYETFGRGLEENLENFQDTIVKCLELLMDPFKTNDELGDPIISQLNFNIEAGFYLINNREPICREIEQTREEAAKKNTIDRKEDTFVQMQGQNFIFRVQGKKKKGPKRKRANITHFHAMMLMGLEKEETQKRIQEQLRLETKINYGVEVGQGEVDFVGGNEDKLYRDYGVLRKEEDMWLLYDVKPKPRNEEFRKSDRIKIKQALPQILWRAFTDSDSLNPLQSAIFPAVYKSDENILCCAPTGAGKTNVALLSVLRLVQRNLGIDGKKVATNFKVVYISPLKALATEVVRKFGAKLGYLGVQVKEYTGDVSLSKQEIQSTHIIVTTPEKWDVVTRKSDSLNSMINLIIIDEIHLLDDERGRVLECLVARTKRLIIAKQCRIRLLGLSATLPNYKDVAEFMNVSSKGLFHFDESFRPVPLRKKFIAVKRPEMFPDPKPARNKDRNRGRGRDRRDDQPASNAKRQVFAKRQNRLDVMNAIAYDAVRDNLRLGHQVLVFVHSRKETYSLGQYFVERAMAQGELNYFISQNHRGLRADRAFENRDLRTLGSRGVGAHNAGLKRKDRHAVERAFIKGQLTVVVCTATLAWGINMPCHTVIIKGTDFYAPGFGFKPISLLDVQQIFGRAGRPQFDTEGEAILITKLEDINYFVSMLSYVKPIESRFKPFMNEALLAEIVLGNVTNMYEATEFIRCTFYAVRLPKNPNAYGMKKSEDREIMVMEDVRQALIGLNRLRLIRFDEERDVIESMELGRIASHYYINVETMEMICFYLRMNRDDEKQSLDDIKPKDLFAIMAQSSEFEQISPKANEAEEIAKLRKKYKSTDVGDEFKDLQVRMQGQKQDQGPDTTTDKLEKVLLLFWGYLGLESYSNYSLVADTNYITQNGTRILRCILEIAIKLNAGYLCQTILEWLRYIENCISEFDSCLRMFSIDNHLRSVNYYKNQSREARRGNFISGRTCQFIETNFSSLVENCIEIDHLRENPSIIRDMRLPKREGEMLKKAIYNFPLIDYTYDVKPIAQTIIQVTLKIKPLCNYNPTFHMPKEIFWVFVTHGSELIHHGQVGVEMKNSDTRPIPKGDLENEVDNENKNGYRNGKETNAETNNKVFQEMRRRKYALDNQLAEVTFFVPYRQDVTHYDLRIMSDRWVNADCFCQINLEGIEIADGQMQYTDLLDLRPLKIGALADPQIEEIYEQKGIRFFNPIQTQVFHTLYHSDDNVLIGSPTGSGKTIVAELAMFRLFKQTPEKKIVYVAPFKALVKERVKDWKVRLEKLGKRVEELTGDYTPDLRTLVAADVLITTPEKWDGVSRSWKSRRYVSSVGLVVFDEIHLLGQDRGPVIEVIVSRTNLISKKLGINTRMVGLTTAIANSADVAGWFGVPGERMFNFRPSVRPVPVEIHFRGFAEKNYCPRMAAMNKPAYNAIKKFAGNLPVLVFVSSRRQTRLTAKDLVSFGANDFQFQSPFLKMNDEEIRTVMNGIKDEALKESLQFGIGMHHAGLDTSDRKIVEELFELAKIQVLVATTTLAWGVNFPAKLVIIKGTEFFDPKLKQYVDMPISDILQMIGRAGRPQFNDKGYACVFVEKTKKNFYRKYLNDPFPIESALLTQLEEHLNAEVASGTIANKQQCVDYLTWTFFFRRVVRNPLYYGLPDGDSETVQKFLTDLVDKHINSLLKHKSVSLGDDEFTLQSTFLGELAAKYYIQPETANYLFTHIKNLTRPSNSDRNSKPYEPIDMLELVSYSKEFEEVPVRHHEPEMNLGLNEYVRFPGEVDDAESPHFKTFLLFQSYLSDLPLPIRDYYTDSKIILDSCMRIIAAIVDICVHLDRFDACLAIFQTVQMLVQGLWPDENPLVNLPYCEDFETLSALKKKGISSLKALASSVNDKDLRSKIESCGLDKRGANAVIKAAESLPDLTTTVKLYNFDEENGREIISNNKRIKSGKEAALIFNISNHNKKSLKGAVKIKKMKKAKRATWWLVVGNQKTNKVYAVKKFSAASRGNKKVIFEVPLLSTADDRNLDIHLVSDSYFGLDVQHQIDLETYRTESK